MNPPSATIPNPTPLHHKAWWCGWILSTTVLPAALGAWGVGAWAHGRTPLWTLQITGLLALVLHFTASLKLTTTRMRLAMLLVFGGWGLIGICFFLGCVGSPRLQIPQGQRPAPSQPGPAAQDTNAQNRKG